MGKPAGRTQPRRQARKRAEGADNAGTKQYRGGSGRDERKNAERCKQKEGANSMEKERNRTVGENRETEGPVLHHSGKRQETEGRKTLRNEKGAAKLRGNPYAPKKQTQIDRSTM